jgi:hypothetical protein
MADFVSSSSHQSSFATTFPRDSVRGRLANRSRDAGKDCSGRSIGRVAEVTRFCKLGKTRMSRICNTRSRVAEMPQGVTFHMFVANFAALPCSGE